MRTDFTRTNSTRRGVEQLQNLPYRQSYTFNAFDDMTERYSKVWGADVNLTRTYAYSNGRISGWQYDADGRVTANQEAGQSAIEYDASGALVEKIDTYSTFVQDSLVRMYDGDGREVKRTDDECRINPLEVPEPTECSWQGAATYYYIRSSVLGGETIAETGSSGQKMISYVRVGSSILAHLRTNRMWQQGGWVTSEAAYYENTDPSGTGFRVTPRLMPANWWDYSDQRKAEFDSGNSNVGLETNYQPVYEPGPSENLPLESESPLYVDGQKASVTIDGVSVSWLVARQMAEAGSTIPAGLASYQSLPGFQFTSNGLGNFSVTIPRQVGWNVTYGPNDGPNGTAYPVYRGSDAYSFTADWALSISPGHTGSGGGRARRSGSVGPSAVFNQKKFDKCLKELFNAKLTSESLEEGLPGLRDDTIWYGATIAGVGVALKTTFEKDSATIGRDLYSRGVGDGSPNSGATFGRTPFHNFIASDVYANLRPMFAGGITGYTSIGFIALKIHELGNGLAGVRRQLAQGQNNPEYSSRDQLRTIGGYGPENKKHGIDDPDAGAALEICVFRGIVNLRTGRVGSTRGL